MRLAILHRILSKIWTAAEAYSGVQPALFWLIIGFELHLLTALLVLVFHSVSVLHDLEVFVHSFFYILLMGLLGDFFYFLLFRQMYGSFQNVEYEFQKV